MRDKILEILKNSGGFISGEEMSRTLGISRAAVWKHIRALKNDGYSVTSVRNRGYMLTSEPDMISPDRIRALLSTSYIGTNILYTDRVDSTNEMAKRNHASAHGPVFIAETQDAGKGRLGRRWESPRGSGIWMSVLLKPDMPPDRVSEMTLAAGLAMCRAIGGNAAIKWPNDIVIGSKKVCGILTEMAAEPDTGTVGYVVCGIGINVGMTEFPEGLKDKATSLFIETGRRTDRNELIAKALSEFEPIYGKLISGGFASIQDEYCANCVTLGREVRVIRRGCEVTGIAEDIDSGGSLTVDTADGRITVSSGEVSVRGIYGYI